MSEGEKLKCWWKNCFIENGLKARAMQWVNNYANETFVSVNQFPSFSAAQWAMEECRVLREWKS